MAQDNFDTIVGANVKIKGNLQNQGSIEIHGTVEGEITSEEDIIIGESANISGPVTARNVDVSGNVVGPIQAAEKLELKPTCRVEGDIKAAVLIIQAGAVFNGSCAVVAEGSATNPKSKKLATLELEE